MSLNGLRVVIDCANAAAYKAAPAVRRWFCADVTAMHDAPDGLNSNNKCGRQRRGLTEEVERYRADISLPLDGDAELHVLVDDTGAVVDGDQMLAFLARTCTRSERLAKDTLLTTVMSTIALDEALQRDCVSVRRTGVR